MLVIMIRRIPREDGYFAELLVNNVPKDISQAWRCGSYFHTSGTR